MWYVVQSKNQNTTKMEGIERIEQLEQTLIQHIRTSAILQTRELLLIDEVLSIRRERRKCFTNALNQNEKFKTENEELKQQLSSIQQNTSKELERILQNHNQERQRHQEEFQTLKQEFELEKRMNRENIKMIESTLTDKLKRSYESKLNIIENKLQEVLTEKQANDIAQARLIADNLVKKVSTELENNYNRKLSEYKQSLVTIANREKDLQDVNRDQLKMIETLQSDNR